MDAFVLPTGFDWPANTFLDEEGVWCQILRPPAPDRVDGPALFLDRDGVIVDEVHYLHTVDEARVAIGAIDIIRAANTRSIPVIVVTNQAGIGRGIYDWTRFATVQAHILSVLKDADAYVDAVFACPFHSTGKPPYIHPDHPARKPNPGMINRGLSALSITAEQSWIIGDRAGDVLAGRNAGLAGGVHLLCGHGSADGERDHALEAANASFTVVGANTLADAAQHIPFLR